MALGKTITGADAVGTELTSDATRASWNALRWQAPQALADAVRLVGERDPKHGERGAIVSVRFAQERIERVLVQRIPPPPPAAQPLVLPPALRQAIDANLLEKHPMLLAYVGPDGQPVLSFRGSTQVHGDDRLAMWVRNPRAPSSARSAPTRGVADVPQRRAAVDLPVARAGRVSSTSRPSVNASSMHRLRPSGRTTSRCSARPWWSTSTGSRAGPASALRGRSIRSVWSGRDDVEDGGMKNGKDSEDLSRVGAGHGDGRVDAAILDPGAEVVRTAARRRADAADAAGRKAARFPRQLGARRRHGSPLPAPLRVAVPRPQRGERHPLRLSRLEIRRRRQLRRHAERAADQDFKDKVKAKAYKVAERNGLVWVYMGRAPSRRRCRRSRRRCCPKREIDDLLHAARMQLAAGAGRRHRHLAFRLSARRRFDPRWCRRTA